MSDRQFMFMIHGVVNDDGTVTLEEEDEAYFPDGEDVWNEATERWERLRDLGDDAFDEYGKVAAAVDVALTRHNAARRSSRVVKEER